MKFIYLSCLALGAALGASALATTPLLKLSDGEDVAIAQPKRFGKSSTPGRAQQGPVKRLGENSPLQPPFVETFDNLRAGMEHDDFQRYFQVIDSNNDNRKWGLYNYAQAVPYGRCAYLLFPQEGVAGADDWLITRAITLEAGKYYSVTLDAALYKDGTPETAQRFEVKMGTYNDADGLKTVVIPATDIYSTTFTHLRGWFCPRVSGKYYIGVHGISPTYQNYYNYLFVDNIAVEAPKSGNEPGEVSDVKFVNDPYGSTRMDISFKAPTLNIAGKALSSISKITVKRDNAVIETYTDVIPGKELNLSDTPTAEGEYGYSFVVENEAGRGVPVEVRHYAGIATPMAPPSIALKENDDHSVEISWEHSTADITGTPINPEALLYKVYQVVDLQPVLLGTTDGINVYDYEPEIPEGEQVLMSAAVRASLNGKDSNPVVSPEIPMGTPYTLPYKNSFTADDHYAQVMTVEREDETITWMMNNDLDQPASQDGDNGYVCMSGSRPDQTSELRTGKIALPEGPCYTSFYTYIYPEDENTVTLTVTDPITLQSEDVETFNLMDYSGRTDWVRLRSDLSKYAGRVVLLGLRGKIVSHGYLPIDNWVVAASSAIDLEVGTPAYPKGAKVGEEFTVSATVTNFGISTSEPITARLMCDGSEIATASIAALGANESAPVELKATFTPVSPQVGSYTIEVIGGQEDVTENNVSAPFQIALLSPSLPVPANLVVSNPEDGSDALLTWTAPALDKAAPAEELEDFEQCIPYAENLDGSEWTTYDADGGYVGGFNGIDLEVANTQQGFWVMENEAPFDFMTPKSGTKMAVQMYGFGEGTHTYTVDCDDWLISPTLYGGPQTASFWACSINGDYGLEIFEVYYSKEDEGMDNFVKLMNVTEAPVDWEQFFVPLPDGARRFAIRCITPTGYMMWVDDITYTPTGAALPLELKGYNVYVDGELKTATPLTATEFTLPGLAKGSRIDVTALYDKGESVPATATFGTSGINSIVTEPAAQDGPAEYFTLQGHRVSEQNLVPGLYIRRQGTRVEKLIIR